MRVLVIAAHPDDEVLGCGGTIARRSREGDEVTIAILGEGVTSRHAERAAADRTVVQALDRRAHEVGKFLGAQRVVTFGLPDNRFDTVPLLDIVKIIEGLVLDVRPDALYTQHGGDLNIDHATVFRATLAATRPMAPARVDRVYAYEVASSTEWAFQQFAPPFHPNVFYDIADMLETKIEAMALYETEMRPFPHPRSREALRAIAMRWGSVVGVGAAEAFQLVREVH